MADVDYTIGLAMGVQTDYETPNAAILALDTGTILAADGTIYGDPQSGQYQSGITPPTHTREGIDRAPILNSYSKRSNLFVKPEWGPMTIAFPFGGANNVATPSAGEAKPDPGIDSLLLCAGMVGANGAAPAGYKYTPANTSTYGTIRLWVGGKSITFAGCMVESLSIPFAGGDISIATASIKMGYLAEDIEANGVSGFTYGDNDEMTPPRSVSSAFTLGTLRGFEEATLNFDNEIVESPDSNNPDQGRRLYMKGRTVTLSGKVYIDSADSDFMNDNLILEVPPTADATWRVGTEAAATDRMNGANFTVKDVQITEWSPDELAEQESAVFSGMASTNTIGDEFEIEFD